MMTGDMQMAQPQRFSQTSPSAWQRHHSFDGWRGWQSKRGFRNTASNI
jgi:hypothetical protein